MEGLDADIFYFRWFYSSSDDVLEVAVTNNGGDPSPTWVPVEAVTNTSDGKNTAWEAAGFRVSDFVSPTADVSVRFRANDADTASIVEAGVDLFRVEELSCDCLCSGDLNGDTFRDGDDIQGFIDCLFGGGSNCGCADGDGSPGLDFQDVNSFVNNLISGTPCIS